MNGDSIVVEEGISIDELPEEWKELFALEESPNITVEVVRMPTGEKVDIKTP